MTEVRVARGSGGVAGRWVRVGPRVVAAAFLTSGTIHLVKPGVFQPLVPRMMPRSRDLVYASGVAELVCAGGLLSRTRWAGPASAALLLAVWPGNLQMALDVTSEAGTTAADRAKVAAVWLRMPLQIPMITAVLADRRRRGDPHP